jgi:hypothetical protein
MSNSQGKNQGKNARAPIGDQSDANKMTDAEKARVAIGHQKRLDADHYLRMPEYKDKQLFWALSNGEADKWLSLGAQPVPRRSKSAKIYKGINDRLDSEYEMVPSVSVVEGVPIDAFLLVMDNEDYKKYRIDPKEARNTEIRNAMGIGKADEEARVMPNVKGLKSYAPNVSATKTGLDVVRGGELQHDM